MPENYIKDQLIKKATHCSDFYCRQCGEAQQRLLSYIIGSGFIPRYQTDLPARDFAGRSDRVSDILSDSGFADPVDTAPSESRYPFQSGLPQQPAGAGSYPSNLGRLEVRSVSAQKNGLLLSVFVHSGKVHLTRDMLYLSPES